MVASILFVCIIVFAIMGLTEFIYIVNLFFSWPGVRTSSVSLVVLKNKIAVKQLNFMWLKIKWMGDGFANGVIAITDNLDEDEIKCCKEFIIAKKIKLYTFSELSKTDLLQGEFFNGNL